MSAENDGVKQQTLLIGIGVSILVGFLGGIVYGTYNFPASPPPVQSSQQSSSTSGQIVVQQPNNATQVTLASLEEATMKNPGDAELWIQLGHAYFNVDQFNMAINAYNKSLEILPANPEILTDLGVMYRRNKQPDLAIATFDRALELNPKYEHAMFNKGVVLFYDLKDKDGAIEVWQQLAVINPFAAAPNGIHIGEIIEKVRAMPEEQD